MQALFSHALVCGNVSYFKFLAISLAPQHIYMLCAKNTGLLLPCCTSCYRSLREYITDFHLFPPVQPVCILLSI